MLKVKAQLLKSKKRIEDSENAKRQRELKKLGKQVGDFIFYFHLKLEMILFVVD
jgi:hypothetical protein